MLDQLKLELEQLGATGRMRELHPLLARANGIVEIRGRRLIDFAGWDPLGLGTHPKPRRAIVGSLDRSGLSSSSSRLSSGTSAEHLACEQRIARFLGMQSAALFSSKNQAVLSLVSALCHEGDLLLCDDQIQSPVVDAAYLVQATVAHFNALDPATLETELSKGRPFRRKFIFIESLLPLNGSLTDLKALLAIVRRHEALLMVDESYAWGTVGLRGAGGIEAAGLAPHDVFAVYGSMSYALASYGAAVAGNPILISYLMQRSRTFSSEIPLPPPIAAAAEEIIGIVELAAAARERIKQWSQRIRDELIALGYVEVLRSGGPYSPFVTLHFQSLAAAETFAALLFQKGFLVETFPIRRVFSELGGVRLIPSAHHGDEQIAQLLSVCADLKKRLDH